MASETDSLGIVDVAEVGASTEGAARTFRHVRKLSGFLALDAICLFARESERFLIGADGSGVAASEGRADVVSAVRNLCELVTQVTRDMPIATMRSAGGGARGSNGDLDAALDAVGEIVVARPQASGPARGESDHANLARQIERLDAITRELQRMAARQRLVPIHDTFRRADGYVHDLAKRAGKAVDVVIVGEDTELDESALVAIADDLFAALRRAVDVNLEMPRERHAAGKRERGRIELRASNTGSIVHVEVADDGRGETHVSSPGAIAELGGDVEERCVSGRGTTWSVHVPLSLAIVEGLLLRVGDQRYVVPAASIAFSVQPDAEQIVGIDRHREMLALEDGFVPILRLHELHVSQTAQTDLTQGAIVVVEHEGKRGAVFACESLGAANAVVKPMRLGRLSQTGEAYSATLPDGEAAMVLDAAELVRASRAMQRG